MSKKLSVVISFILIIIGVGARLLPHAPNVTPLTAIALFAATYLSIRYAAAIILATMVLTDFWIGAYDWRVMAAVYGSLLLAGAIGLLVRKKISFITAGAGALAASVLFFAITNWAVWQFGTMYNHSMAGLMQSYTMAIPFFKNSLLGDLGYTAILFGSLELFQVLAKQPVKSLLKLS